MSNDDARLVAAVPFVERLENVGFGDKARIVEQACSTLGVSAQSFYRLRQRIVGERSKKKRSDAGALALSYANTLTVSAYLMAAFRKNGKQNASLKKTVQVLRANGTLRAERVISTTGEIVELSDSTIARALRHYGLHPEQLTRPAPHAHLCSPHANWCWQMDASVCVIYYLPKGGAMIREMKESEFYTGKPENWNRIAGQMVIRYLMTEHRWGMFRLHYVHGAESGDNACDHLIRTLLAPADDRGMLWGVPAHLMVDPGSAQTGRKFKRLCRRLGIKLIINKAGNPRAKGQVEQGHNLVEQDFEHGLKLLSRQIRDIDDLNRLADFWQRHANANQIHTRHGRTRYAGWSADVMGHLIAPPPEVVMRDLATNDPEPRQVADDLSISWQGRPYFAGNVPDIRQGESVLVHVNPWRGGEVVLIREDADGRELQFPLAEMVRDEAGQYSEHGATIGLDYKVPSDTVLDTNRKAVTRLIAGEAALKAAEAKLKRKGTVPLEALGIDPLIVERKADTPSLTPAAQPHGGAPLPVMMLSMVRAARLIRDGLGRDLTDAEFDWIRQRWADGVPEGQITGLVAQFARPAEAPTADEANRIERVA